MTNRATTALRLGAVAGATLVATGCGVFSPVQTDEAYIPADGTDLTMPGLELRNVVVVTEGEGDPGVVVGQAVNRGPDAVEVQFSLDGGTPATASVPAFSGGSLTDGGSQVTLTQVPSAPGTLVDLVVVTQEAGQNVVSVPVLPPERYYAEYSPEPAPAESATPGGTATPEPTASEG